MHASRVNVRRMFGWSRALGVIPLVIWVWGLWIHDNWTQLIGNAALAASSLVMLALFGYLAVRAFMLRVVIENRALRVRQWWRTTVIPVDEIGAVFGMSYSGYLNWGGIGDPLDLAALTPMVAITRTRNGETSIVELPALNGPFWSAAAREERLRRAIAEAAQREIGDTVPADFLA